MERIGRVSGFSGTEKVNAVPLSLAFLRKAMVSMIRKKRSKSSLLWKGVAHALSSSMESAFCGRWVFWIASRRLGSPKR
jgi:hypothetical protein